MPGGAGTRLHPLTLERCKPAVPLAGKYRLVDIPISNCLNSGINRMFLLTQFQTASLHRHVQSAYHFDPFGGGFVDILAAEQTERGSDWYQGTADAVRRNLLHFRAFPHDLVLILSGDQLYRMDYAQMLAAHQKSGADVTIAGKLIDRGEGVELTDEIVPPELLEDMTPGTLEAGQFDGTQYGLMVSMNVKSLVFYNKQAWDEAGYEAPETLDDLAALTDQIKSDGGTPWCFGIESGPATGWPVTDWYEDLIMRFGGADTYEQWVTNEVPFDSDVVRQAADYMEETVLAEAAPELEAIIRSALYQREALLTQAADEEAQAWF